MGDLASPRERILQAVEKGYRRQVSWRRHFHRYPELSFEELKTTRHLKDTLREIGIKLLPLKLKTGVLGELDSGRPGKTIAVRSDIDALAVTEETALPYRSRCDGCMHACGHDAHMAIALGTAAVLRRLVDHMKGKVRFVFQPAEEMPPGGAELMIDRGALEGVSMILGLHVDPHLDVGKISLLDGPAMAAVIDFDLTIVGTGGHVARPHTGVDAIATATEVVESLQKVVSREIDPLAPVVISFGRIQGGTARNVIASRVRLEGTARALSPALVRRLPGLIKRTASGICRARGAKAEVKVIAGYPALVNDPVVNGLLKRTYEALFGQGRVEETERVLGGEDFARYLEMVPGAMFRLGVRNPKLGADQPWHSPRFAIDEEALKYGTALLAAAAISYLTDSTL